MTPEDEDDDDFRAWENRLPASRARRAAIQGSVEARRAELPAARQAARKAELERLRPVMDFVAKRLKP